MYEAMGGRSRKTTKWLSLTDAISVCDWIRPTGNWLRPNINKSNMNIYRSSGWQKLKTNNIFNILKVH